MGETKIEWTATSLPDGTSVPGYTFNPWTGCTKVSAACDHCYAEAWAKRSGIVEWGNHPRRRTSPDYWRQPLNWNRRAQRDGVRRKVFCASLADVFDNQVPEEWRTELWALVGECEDLDWLLLTKRPQNIAKMLPPNWGTIYKNGWSHVWLGTTVENQEEADRRIPHLLSIPAAKRFLSCEPLLGTINLTFPHIDWVIAGGESGPNARPMHPDWIRGVRDQCKAFDTPFFFKQWGEWREFNHGSLDTEIDADSKIGVSILACAVNPGFITRDGRFYYNRAYLPEEIPCRLMERVGKKKAGALLDGVEHRAGPGQTGGQTT